MQVEMFKEQQKSFQEELAESFKDSGFNAKLSDWHFSALP